VYSFAESKPKISKMIVTDSTPMAMLTVGQLKEVLTPYGGNVTLLSNERHYAYGLRGIAKIFDCSIPTAQRIKASGIIDGAIVQAGRKIVLMLTAQSNWRGARKKQPYEHKKSSRRSHTRMLQR
jgi:hypothetical protein